MQTINIINTILQGVTILILLIIGFYFRGLSALKGMGDDYSRMTAIGETAISLPPECYMAKRRDDMNGRFS